MKRFAMITLLALLLCCLGASAEGLPPESSWPSEFSYSYGSFHGGYWEYELEWDDGRLMFEAEGKNGVDLDIKRAVQPDVMGQLQQIIEQHELDSWNGFKQSDRDVLDGYGFDLEYERDHIEYEAEGYMIYPENYEAAHEALAAFFEGLTVEVGR